MATDKSPKSTKPVDDDERDEREDDDEEEDVPAKKPAPKKAASKPAPRRARADEEDDDDEDDDDDDDDDDEDDDDEDDDDAPKSRNLTPVPRTPRKPRAFYIGAMAAGLAVVAYYAFKMNKNGKDDFWMHGVAVLGISLIVWGFMGIGSENEIDPETTSG